MITFKQFMEVVDYRITEGSDFGWRCFGPNAHSLSSWNGDYSGWSSNIVFDTKSQQVYTVEICDYKNKRAYRLLNPDYKSAHDQEADERDVSAREAWDECDFVDLDVDEDWLKKAKAIVAGEDYDTRVVLPVELPDDILMLLFQKAHEEDITFNQYMENILKDAIERVKQEHPGADWSLDDTMRDEYDFSDAKQVTVAKSKKLKKKKGKA